MRPSPSPSVVACLRVGCGSPSLLVAGCGRTSSEIDAARAEALFVFRDDGERSGAIEDTVRFLDSIFAGRVLAYRERLGSVTAWLRADRCHSILSFGTLDEITSRKPDRVEAVHEWRRE